MRRPQNLYNTTRMNDRGTGDAGARVAPLPQVIAVRALRAIDGSRAFSNRILADLLERGDAGALTPGARGLVTALVYGVLRHRTRLDVHIDAAARDPARLGAVVRDLLRVGAYELVELGRQPGNAIGHAVDAARAFDRSRTLSGLAHGILGTIATNAAAIDARLAAAAPLDVLDKRHSIPRWLAGRWLGTAGPERAVRRALCMGEVPAIDLRVDVTRITTEAAAERLAAERPRARIAVIDGLPNALRVNAGGDLFYDALHDEGLVSVQGAAAQAAGNMLGARAGERVLDACAGLGVKTLQLAEQMDRTGVLVAADVDARKLDGLDRLRARGRLDDPRLELHRVVADLTAPSETLTKYGPFDRILLDAPCTGLGNLARHPEIRWLRRYEDIATAAARQAQMLATMWPLLRPGGTLVYAVCSGEREEGSGVVSTVLETAPLDLTVERTWTPEEDGTEGFYAATLVRREA